MSPLARLPTPLFRASPGDHIITGIHNWVAFSCRRFAARSLSDSGPPRATLKQMHSRRSPWPESRTSRFAPVRLWQQSMTLPPSGSGYWLDATSLSCLVSRRKKALAGRTRSCKQHIMAIVNTDVNHTKVIPYTPRKIPIPGRVKVQSGESRREDSGRRSRARGQVASSQNGPGDPG